VTAQQTLTVLVHGLWVHGVVMAAQRRALQRRGFPAVCYSYPTMRLTLAESAARLARFARALSAPQIHWVGHSMGGLVVLQMLLSHPDVAPGRVVLEGVPCRGSRAARALARSRIGARALGRSMRECLEGDAACNLSGREIGVIAGTLGAGLGRLVAPDLPRPHDGTVAVCETELAVAADAIALPVSHSGMVFSPRVAAQICAFLRDGRFERNPP
jgi:pimeloyl-ACP methyl ester carboxylesterase